MRSFKISNGIDGTINYFKEFEKVVVWFAWHKIKLLTSFIEMGAISIPDTIYRGEWGTVNHGTQ